MLINVTFITSFRDIFALCPYDEFSTVCKRREGKKNLYRFLIMAPEKKNEALLQFQGKPRLEQRTWLLVSLPLPQCPLLCCGLFGHFEFVSNNKINRRPSENVNGWLALPKMRMPFFIF